MSSFEPSFELHGRLSVFLGVVRLQELGRRYPEAKVSELVRIAAAVSADYASADWAVAASVSAVFGDLTLDEDASSMRRFLDRLLVHDRPLWLLACIRGRAAARAAMPTSVRQCLTFARVLGSSSDEDAVHWWDVLVGAQREAGDLALKEKGREGERLTLEYEAERLRALGVAQGPQWVALDDEGLGYDVLSYEVGPAGDLQNKLIEVKACSGLPLEIYITRGEWRLAEQAGDAYAFHVWHLPTQRLVQLSVAEIAPHVPHDRGFGLWQNVRIRLPQGPTPAGLEP